jgi:hypothetical protein
VKLDGPIASLKSRTASSCFYLGRAREALQLPRNPTASDCTKNEGTPTRYVEIALLDTSSNGAFAFSAQGKTDAVMA